MIVVNLKEAERRKRNKKNIKKIASDSKVESMKHLLWLEKIPERSRRSKNRKNKRKIESTLNQIVVREAEIKNKSQDRNRNLKK